MRPFQEFEIVGAEMRRSPRAQEALQPLARRIRGLHFGKDRVHLFGNGPEPVEVECGKGGESGHFADMARRLGQNGFEPAFSF